MADVTLPLTHVRDEPARAEVRERFLTLPRSAAVLAFVLFALTFDDGQVADDGTVYFNFLRRLFGADTTAVA